MSWRENGAFYCETCLLAMIEFLQMYASLLGWIALHPFQSFGVVLAQFFAVMWLHNRYHNPYLHILLALWFVPQDVVGNVFLFTIVGLELPQEWTVTSRLKRWKKLQMISHPLGAWRFYVATKLCKVLNKAELGHC